MALHTSATLYVDQERPPAADRFKGKGNRLLDDIDEEEIAPAGANVDPPLILRGRIANQIGLDI